MAAFIEGDSTKTISAINNPQKANDWVMEGIARDKISP